MKYLTQRAGRAVDAEAHPRLAPDEALQLGAALPAQGTLLHRTGTHYCNIIEAPWLANGGHRASFRHHNDRAPSCTGLLAVGYCMARTDAVTGIHLVLPQLIDSS
jgi:hypothetical protein